MNRPATVEPLSRSRLILILGAIVAIGPLSIDMYLPALPTLQRHFATDAAATQLTLAIYFLGLAVGQLVYGPLSDRIGRKGPLLFGLGVYVLASLGCAFAPSIDALTLMRLLQALGGCAGMVITRAMVRDRFEPQEMARVLSALVLVMGVAPILAPLIGGQLLLAFGWQSIFGVLAVFGALCFLLAARQLSDTRRDTTLAHGNVISGYLRLIAHRRFMAYALSGGIAQAGMFAYISGSSFVFIEVFGIRPDLFGWIFGANAFGLIAAAQMNARLLQRYRSEVVLRWALRVNAACGVIMLFNASTGFGGLWGVLPPLFVAMSSLGFTFPNSTAAAMAPFGDRAGLAAALLGTLQFSIAALAAAVVGHVYDGTAVPMAAVIAACGLSALTLLRVLAGPLQVPEPHRQPHPM